MGVNCTTPTHFYVEWNPTDGTTRYAWSSNSPWIQDIEAGKAAYEDESGKGYILLKVAPLLPLDLD